MNTVKTTCSLFVCVFLVCGCSTPKFEEYHGSEILQGKGGELHSVDGIDFWENGDPDRKYKILGDIEESPKQRPALGRVSRLFSNPDDRDSAVAKVAHEKGGDAVVIVAKAPEPFADADEATDGQYGNLSL
jgi:hypothetical protein